MKEKEKKQNVGIWLDNNKAIIITKGSEDEFAVTNHVKANEHHGGGSEHSINNSKQADNNKFFKSISNLVSNYDEILLFGPGKSQEQLQNLLHEDPQFKSKKIAIDASGQLTEPQMVAQVRDFFKNRQ